MKTEYLSRQDVIAKLQTAQGGDTLTEMAERVGCSPGAYHDIISGRRAPSEKVLKFLSTPTHELVEEVVYRFNRR